MIPLAVLLRCRSTPSVWVGTPFGGRDSRVLPGFLPQAYSSWTPPGHRVDRRGQARTGPRLGPAPPALSIRAFVWVDRRTSLRERKVLGASRVTPPFWAATTFCPGCLQPTRDFRFALQRTTQYRGLDFCTSALWRFSSFPCPRRKTFRCTTVFRK